MGAQKGNSEKVLGDGTDKVLKYKGVKKLGMKNKKGCVMGGILGILGQRYDEQVSRKTKKCSLPSDPRFIEVLNGRTKG